MIAVKSRSHAYEVRFSEALDLALAAAIIPKKTLLLVDSNILRLYPSNFLDQQIIPIIANEENKSYGALEKLFCQVIETGIKRDHKLVVVGGGVVQDIGCFIASTLFRGLWWDLIPTTLLAQADSCIGGKSSLNIGKYKNQLGTFYAPHLIHIVPSVLATLTPDEMASGLGEMIKLHWIGGVSDFANLKRLLSQEWQRDTKVARTCVESSLLIKKRFIEVDEFDQGVRNLLNFGHTFGHAFESVTQFAIPHGIAVSLGMLAAVKLSEQLDWIAASVSKEFEAFIKPYFHPFESHLKKIPTELILTAMRRDKKNQGEGVTCILTRGPGNLEKLSVSAETVLQPFLEKFISECCHD